MPAPLPPVDVEEYRRLSDLVTAGLAVVTTRSGRHDVAATVDSYLDVSYDPPTMLVALYAGSRIGEAVEDAGHFCLSVLSGDQHALADRLGTPGAPILGMLEGVDVERTADGDAAIRGALAHFAVRVEHRYVAATHLLHVGPVVEMAQGAGGDPAIRFAAQARELR
ncbi:flavin reductase family protein [Brachybacterium hainanense]|uniref:Flavin reductase family protein n=1 Tax=Brachybacterium hainanense TaxID=1541174 RepID=A0ABV6RFI0_9MICO